MGDKKYGREWKNIRREYVEKHPYCELCGAPVEEVHHKLPISEGGTNDFSNLMSVCRTCHKKFH